MVEFLITLLLVIAGTLVLASFIFLITPFVAYMMEKMEEWVRKIYDKYRKR